MLCRCKEVVAGFIRIVFALVARYLPARGSGKTGFGIMCAAWTLCASHSDFPLNKLGTYCLDALYGPSNAVSGMLIGCKALVYVSIADSYLTDA